MRNEFLGDSLDMAKRALVHILSSDGFRVFVFPLPAVHQFNFELYEKLLDVKPLGNVEVMNESALVFRYPARAKYVKWMIESVRTLDRTNKLVVLLDPDKGIHSQKQTCKFLSINEISELTAANEECVVGIYHHKGAGGYLYANLVAALSPLHSFAYDFGAAAICFVSHNNRLEDLKSFLRDELNPSNLMEGT